MALKTILTAATIPALICAASAPSPGQNDAVRIIGGIAALKGDVPFTVSLEKFTGFCFCGGSLLDSSTVLTAAHRVMDLDVDNALVRAGSLVSESDTKSNVVGDVNETDHKQYASFGGVTSSLSSIIVHSNYLGLPDVHNDIAILKLAEPIPAEGGIEYPVLAASESDPFSAQFVTSAGC